MNVLAPLEGISASKNHHGASGSCPDMKGKGPDALLPAMQPGYPNFHHPTRFRVNTFPSSTFWLLPVLEFPDH